MAQASNTIWANPPCGKYNEPARVYWSWGHIGVAGSPLGNPGVPGKTGSPQKNELVGNICV